MPEREINIRRPFESTFDSTFDSPNVTLALLAGGKSSRFGGKDKQFWSYDGEALGRIAAKNLLASSVFASGHATVLVVCEKKEMEPRAEEAQEKILSLNHTTLYKDLPVQVVFDRFSGMGPLGGLETALYFAQTPWLYLAACDMPCFDDRWLNFLLELSKLQAAGLVTAGRTSGSSDFLEMSGSLDAFQAIVAAHGAGYSLQPASEADPKVDCDTGHYQYEPFHALYAKSLEPQLEQYLESCRSVTKEGRSEVRSTKSVSIMDFLATIPYLRIPEEVVRHFAPDWRLFANINTVEDARNFAASTVAL
ncbi:MAG TPA: molybdenum cofactor guanylyltransferase [Spirochaetales bacterium]|nr:molybdenum cofactor guanylyltransferase [Spirochaetales bacterium]